jgi:hypothetical protein
MFHPDCRLFLSLCNACDALSDLSLILVGCKTKVANANRIAGLQQRGEETPQANDTKDYRIIFR